MTPLQGPTWPRMLREPVLHQRPLSAPGATLDRPSAICRSEIDIHHHRGWQMRAQPPLFGRIFFRSAALSGSLRPDWTRLVTGLLLSVMTPTVKSARPELQVIRQCPWPLGPLRHFPSEHSAEALSELTYRAREIRLYLFHCHSEGVRGSAKLNRNWF